MGRKKDRFWDFVEKLNCGFTCKFCGRYFAGGATRIKSHLAGYRGRDIDICEKVTLHVREEAQLAIGGVDKEVNSSASTSRTATKTTLGEKLQSLEYKLQDMHNEYKNFQSQIVESLNEYKNLQSQIVESLQGLECSNNRTSLEDTED
ncbi:putative disease resistance protein RGA3 [Fagus crenata]